MFILTDRKAGALNYHLHSGFSGNLFEAFENYILSGHALLYLARQDLKRIINFILLQENLEKEFPDWDSLQ